MNPVSESGSVPPQDNLSRSDTIPHFDTENIPPPTPAPPPETTVADVFAEAGGPLQPIENMLTRP